MLVALQLCFALLLSLAGAPHGNVLPAADIDDGDAEGGAPIASADEHGQRAPVGRVSEDEIGLEVVQRHLETGEPGGDVAGHVVDEILTRHHRAGRSLHTSGGSFRINSLARFERWESLPRQSRLHSS